MTDREIALFLDARANVMGRLRPAGYSLFELDCFRAGLERAAKICDDLVDSQLADVMDGDAFAAAIRKELE